LTASGATRGALQKTYALIEVATDGRMGSTAVVQLWVAVGPPRDGLESVLAKVPLGWAAKFCCEIQIAGQMRALGIQAGNARELAF
jgi:hypothetical protein